MATLPQQRGHLVLPGIGGEIIAGVVFAMAEMVMAVALGASFFAPLQMLGAIVPFSTVRCLAATSQRSDPVAPAF